MKVAYILLFCMLLPFGSRAQWSKDRSGGMTYHCAANEFRSLNFEVRISKFIIRLLHRFVTRRQGYLEMLVYRPSAAWPQREETFTYIIPTVNTEKIEKILSTY